MADRLYQELAQLVLAYQNCSLDSNKQEFATKHKSTINTLVKRYMPSGSGFDNGTKLDLDYSTGEKLVFRTAFHHMNDAGYYDEWTDHAVIVRPSLAFGFELRISGPNKNDIKELIHSEFNCALHITVESE